MAGTNPKYFVFAEDRQVYGPADTPLLQEWGRQGLISGESWVFEETENCWKKAVQITELCSCLATPTPLPGALPSMGGLSGGQLRRIRLFSDMTNEQAETFVNLLEKVKVRALQPIVKQGEHGSSMFLILEGEARVSVKTQGREESISMLGVGDFFGEIALLDAGPRSADVTANKDCVLLQLSKQNFEKIVAEYPDLASRFLVAMNRFLGNRIRQTNDRFVKAKNFAQSAKGGGQIAGPGGVRWKGTSM